jgi:hypothetical protein
MVRHHAVGQEDKDYAAFARLFTIPAAMSGRGGFALSDPRNEHLLAVLRYVERNPLLTLPGGGGMSTVVNGDGIRLIRGTLTIGTTIRGRNGTQVEPVPEAPLQLEVGKGLHVTRSAAWRKFWDQSATQNLLVLCR